MAEDYSAFQTQGALSRFLNLKRVFVDAQRQQQIDAIKEQRKQYFEAQESELDRQGKLKQIGATYGNYQPTAEDLGVNSSAMATNGGLPQPQENLSLQNGNSMAADGSPIWKPQADDTQKEGMEIAGYTTKGKPYFKKSAERVALMSMDTKKGENLDSMATNSLGAIDSFNSLRNTYYEGFTPVDIKVDEATLFDATSNKAKQFAKKLDAQLGRNPAASTYLNNLKGFATTISRGGFQEKGTLTDTDRAVVVNMFNLTLANKEEADYAFGTIGEILAKPSIRAALFRMQKFNEPFESIELPQEIKDKVQMAVDEGYLAEQALNYLLNKKYSRTP